MHSLCHVPALAPVAKYNGMWGSLILNLPSDILEFTPLRTKAFVISPKIMIMSGNPVPLAAAAIKPTTIKSISTQSA